VEFTKKEAYALQIAAYLRGGQMEEACALAEKMVEKFPDQPLAHFMAAKSYYFAGIYDKAKMEGLRAYNISSSREDMLVGAFVAASAMFMLGEYEKGHQLALQFKDEKDEELKKLLVLFSIAMKNENEAARYYLELYELNRTVAERFIRQLAEAGKPASQGR